MASALGRSSSLTDVAGLQQKFRSYGFTADEKVKQSYMITPFDLLERVGLQNTTYPKQPLGSYSDRSFFDSGCRSSLRGHDRNQSSSRKVKSATVILPDQKLSGKSAPGEKMQLPDAGFIGNGACFKSKFQSTEQLRKRKKSRIPVTIATANPTSRASRSATQFRQIGEMKVTVVKRHFSSPNLGRNIPSQIPVRILKENKNGSITKSNGDAVKSSRSVTNTSSEDSLSGRKKQSPPISPHPSSLKTKNKPVVNSSFGSEPTEKWARGFLVLPVGDEKGDDVQSGGSADLDEKDHQAVLATFLNHKGPGEANKPKSVTSSRLLHQEKLHDAAVSRENEQCRPKASYHQSSILLLTCETDCSSDSGADTDKEERTRRKLPETGEDTIMKSEFMSKDSANSKPEPVIERDSGIALSRLTLVDNQSSLLITSHDTDCISDSSCDDDLRHVSSKDSGPQNVEGELSFVQATTSDTDPGSEEGLLQELSDTSEETQVVSSFQTDAHSEDNHPKIETGNDSLEISSTTQMETTLPKEEKQCSDAEAEFLHMACVLNATDLSPVRPKEHVIHKDKTRRHRNKRAKQQSTHKVPDGSMSPRVSNKWVSETLSSSEEEDNEPRHSEGTRESVTELGNFEKENILLRGELQRLKQTNSTLRSDTRSLLNHLENEADKNELLNGKSYRLRTQVKSLKRKMKGTKTKSRQREKALKTVVDNLHQELAFADKLTYTLKSSLQESDNLAAEQKVKLLQVNTTMCEQNTKLKQLEERVTAQRVELHRADELVSWQQAELRRENELIEAQKSELRVADEETVNQLEQFQCAFAVLEQQEIALEEAKELSETRRKRVAKLKEHITLVVRKLPQIEEKLHTERSNNYALQEQVVVLNNQLQASRGLEQQTAESNKALELRKQQLSHENEQLKQELDTLKLQSKLNSLAQVELENTLHAQRAEFVREIEIPANQNTEANAPMKSETTQTFQESNLQAESTLVVSDRPLEDPQEPGSAVEQKRSEGSLSNEADSANVTANERNASRFIWLMSECSQLKEMVRKFESEHHSLVQRTDAEREMMRREIDRLMEEGLRKDKELDMMESSLEELGKVKNHEITGLKQALRRFQESSARLKEELGRKEEELRMMAVTKPNNKWFGGRQQ